MKAPVDMIECDIPNNKVDFRWGIREIEVTRLKNGAIRIRANNVGRLVVEPEVCNTIVVKVKDF